jgi:hypothetical protein
MRDIEHNIAVAFMTWWSYAHKGFGVDDRLLFAIPNGGARHIWVAKKLKAEGVRAGVSDYFLAVPVLENHGLFLELKAGGNLTRKGVLSPEQKAFGRLVSENGYAFDVAYGIEEAIKSVRDYLLGPVID